MKIAFDIGGLISRYPEQMTTMMRALIAGGVEVYIITDMNQQDALTACRENNLDFIPPERILSGDWSKCGDRCKTVLCEEHEIDIMVDDRPDYCAEGNFIGLVLSPRPQVLYYAPGWVNRSTSAIVVPPEEYEEFQRWRQKLKVKSTP